MITSLPRTRVHGKTQDRRKSNSRHGQSLLERMHGQYWRIARRRKVLCFICQIFREDIEICPLQFQETIERLLSLRRAVQKAGEFYCGLSPASMKQIDPWGTIYKLRTFEHQVTELILYISAMHDAAMQDNVVIRIELHLLIRQLFPVMLIAYEDLTSQLRALVEKAQERGRISYATSVR